MQDKEFIQQFIDQTIIAKGDYQLLDILWVFSYSLPSKTAFNKHGDTFKKWLEITCRRCLETKHNLTLSQAIEKIDSLLSLLNSISDFLSYDAYDENSRLLHKILSDKTSVMLLKGIEQRISVGISGELEKKYCPLSLLIYQKK